MANILKRIQYTVVDGTIQAVNVTYDNTTSGLTATDVQSAIDEIVAGGGGGTASRYTLDFLSADWVLAVDDYILSISAATHGKGLNPTITTYFDNGSLLEEVEVSVSIDGSGNVVLYVTSSPDNRFDGKLIII